MIDRKDEKRKRRVKGGKREGELGGGGVGGGTICI